MKKIILAVMFLVPSMSVAASSGGSGFNVGLSGLIYNLTASGDSYTTAAKDNNTYLNYKVGYLMSNGLYFGAVYDTLSRSLDTSNQSRTATGLQLGYHSSGYFLDFSYFLGSEYKLSDTTTDKEGSGFGLEVGYNTMVSSNFYVGVELNYTSLSYKKRVTSSVEATLNNTFTDMYPMLNAGFMF